MYAIIRSGGKQHRVKKDDVIDVELLNVDQGSAVEFSEVLFVYDGESSLIGEPVVSGWLVKGEVIGTSAGPKVSSLKYRPRGHTQKHWGHRQHYSRIKITDIENTEKSAPKKEAAKKTEKVSSEKKEKTSAKVKTTEAKAVKPKAAPKQQKKKEEDK